MVTKLSETFGLPRRDCPLLRPAELHDYTGIPMQFADRLPAQRLRRYPFWRKPEFQKP